MYESCNCNQAGSFAVVSTMLALSVTLGLLRGIHLGQMYASGIGKATHLVSDAPSALSFFTKFLPVSHDTAGLHCKSQPGPFNETFCPCGQAGRVELWCPGCVGIPQPWGNGSAGFGLHTISYNASAPGIIKPTPRPIGNISIKTIEEHVTRKFRAAASAGGYDAFLDFSTGLWVSDLDPFVRSFMDKSQYRTLPIEWADEVNNRTYYSLMVQVANASFTSYVLLEFMSATQTLLHLASPGHRLYRAPHPRFLFSAGQKPEDIFPALNDTVRVEVGGRAMSSFGAGLRGRTRVWYS